MFKIENEKLKPFLVVAILHVGFSCAVLGNEFMSINNRYVGGNFPIEHKYSWARVSLFCAVAIIGLILNWRFWGKKPLHPDFPSRKSVLLVAIVLTLMSTLVGYDSVTGWCCEVFPTRYFGFPFSYLMGGSRIGIFVPFDLQRILKYNFLSYPFFLNVLFWSNTMLIFLSSGSFFIQRGSFTQQKKEQGIT